MIGANNLVNPETHVGVATPISGMPFWFRRSELEIIGQRLN